MGSIVRYFEWCLSDIKLRLSSSNYSTNSPTYSIGNSLCNFYLKFSFSGKLQEANKLSVLLCRCYDDGPTEVNVNFTLSLKTVNGYILGTSENTCSFPKGGSEGFSIVMTNRDLLSCQENEYDMDAFIVTCQAVALELSFSHLSEDIRALSADLLKLRRESHCANAYLIAEEERIPVHKEILGVRSSFFKLNFLKSDCLFDTRFPAVVVKAMLDFLYSGDISKVDIGSLCLEQLYICAEHYEVLDLVKLLTPRKKYITTIADCKKEVYTLQFPNFTTLCKTVCSVEQKGIKMKCNNHTEMNTKILFEPYLKYGKIILETSLRNLVDVKSLLVRLFVLDNSNIARYVDEIPLEPDNEGRLKFYVEYKSDRLFSERDIILPKDIFTLRYELTFRFTGEFHISDPECLKNVECKLMNHEASSLIKNMEYLRKSRYNADALLVLPPVKSSAPRPQVQVSVHKSVLSARSSAFRDMFQSSPKVNLDIPAFVTKNLLKYMYTGVLPACRPGMLDLLHKAAETYDIIPLKRACEDVVAKVTLDIRNIYSIYLIAMRGELYELQKSCKDFIAENKDIILGSFRWERMRKANLKGCEEIKNYIAKKMLTL